MAFNLHAFNDPQYKLDDFITVAAYGYTGYTLFVNTKSSGANTIQDFIAYGKANPGKLTFATLGPGSAPALVANRFDSFAQLGWREIPFKSAADAVAAVVSGTVDVYMAAPSTALASLGQPNIKVFAVSGDVRSPVLPNVPTFAELGYAVNDSISLGVFAPRGTPPAVVEKLRWSIEESKKNSENRKKIEATGLQIYERDYQHFNARLKTDGDIFAADMKRLNIEPE